MKRFFKELRSPSLKCERIGHNIRTTKEEIRRECSGVWVCEDHLAEIKICSRCGHLESVKDIKWLEGYNSVTMPQSDWRKMRENGFLILA